MPMPPVRSLKDLSREVSLSAARADWDGAKKRAEAEAKRFAEAGDQNIRTARKAGFAEAAYKDLFDKQAVAKKQPDILKGVIRRMNLDLGRDLDAFSKPESTGFFSSGALTVDLLEERGRKLQKTFKAYRDSIKQGIEKEGLERSVAAELTSALDRVQQTVIDKIQVAQEAFGRIAESDEALAMKLAQAASRQRQYRPVHVFNQIDVLAAARAHADAEGLVRLEMLEAAFNARGQSLKSILIDLHIVNREDLVRLPSPEDDDGTSHVFTVGLYEAASLETVARDFNTAVTALPFFLFAENYEDRLAHGYRPWDEVLDGLAELLKGVVVASVDAAGGRVAAYIEKQYAIKLTEKAFQRNVKFELGYAVAGIVLGSIALAATPFHFGLSTIMSCASLLKNTIKIAQLAYNRFRDVQVLIAALRADMESLQATYTKSAMAPGPGGSPAYSSKGVILAREGAKMFLNNAKEMFIGLPKDFGPGSTSFKTIDDGIKNLVSRAYGMREEVNKAIRNLVKLLDDIQAMEAQLDRDAKALGDRAISGPRLPSTRAGLDDYWRRIDPDGMRFVIRTCRTRITAVRRSVEELLRSIDHEVPTPGGMWQVAKRTTKEIDDMKSGWEKVVVAIGVKNELAKLQLMNDLFWIVVKIGMPQIGPAGWDGKGFDGLPAIGTGEKTAAFITKMIDKPPTDALGVFFAVDQAAKIAVDNMKLLQFDFTEKALPKLKDEIGGARKDVIGGELVTGFRNAGRAR
jgi:hypothetical protein